MRPFSPYLIGVLFILAGVLHFVRPEAYARIVPPFLPYPRALVYLSGVAEIVGGVGMLIPSLRSWAGVWLIAVLMAVFPANLYMAFAPERAGFGIAPVWLWLRLPLQLVLIAWVWWAARVADVLRG
jgi:uncharacterized membrane protein